MRENRTGLVRGWEGPREDGTGCGSVGEAAQPITVLARSERAFDDFEAVGGAAVSECCDVIKLTVQCKSCPLSQPA